AMLGGGLVADMLGKNGSTAANVAMNADLYNRQLHPDEQARAQQISAASGGKYTVQQVGDAMRAASNSQLGENVTTGMVVDGVSNPQGVYDTGGAYSVPSKDGRTLVQTVPNQVDPGLAAYIRSMTGGSASPYGWDAGTLGTVAAGTPTTPANPFAPAPNGCITAECAAGLGQQGRGLLPDYAAAGGTVQTISVGGAANLYDGTIYTSGGATYSRPAASWMPSGYTTFGWIFGANDAIAANSFMDGSGNQIGISIPTPFRFNIVGAITHAYGGSTAIEFGLGTPGPLSGGVTPWSYSSKLTSESK
ncbi:polymorphic toxin type 22 domain-containing protein, partial [Cupriavidus basilensis]|uniref:polymorphic toxin type 22 domain-containing protein n=1 Tax=Cupriavidus basilensis TaxID=68895 RepID=UPI001ED94969